MNSEAATDPTATSEAPGDQWIGQFVLRRLKAIEGGYLPSGSRTRPTSAASYALAVLRRAKPHDITGDLSSWGLVFDGFNPEWQTDGGTPSPRERATHAALTLWARHQQARPSPVHASGISIGRAVGKLQTIKGEAEDGPCARRFHSVITATSSTQRLYHLRTLISLLRSEGVQLDYARLADDLYKLESTRHRKGVLLRWARDLHRIDSRTDQPGATSATTNEEQQQ